MIQKQMQKFNLVKQIIKTDTCTYYSAEDAKTKEPLLIKRIQRDMTWNGFLSRNEFIYAKDNIHFLKLKYTIREKDKYYCVFQQAGQNLFLHAQKNLQISEIILILAEILKLTFNLYQHQLISPIFMPEHLFLKHKTLKIAHLDQNYAQKYQSPESSSRSQKSLSFSIGCFIAQMITGVRLRGKTQDQYLKSINEYFEEDYKNAKQTFQYRDAINILKKMILKDPMQRVGIQIAYQQFKEYRILENQQIQQRLRKLPRLAPILPDIKKELAIHRATNLKLIPQNTQGETKKIFVNQVLITPESIDDIANIPFVQMQFKPLDQEKNIQDHESPVKLNKSVSGKESRTKSYK